MALDSVKLSKTLAHMLRHSPGTYGIALDDQGWAKTMDVYSALQKKSAMEDNAFLDYNTIEKAVMAIVAQDDKQRFTIDQTNGLICAEQGHSIPVQKDYDEQTPPKTLYHGTHLGGLRKILAEGISKMQRHHVHMNDDFKTAITVGKRRGKPYVLVIDTEAMANDGHKFYLTDNNVWLTDHVPAEYIEQVWSNILES